MQSCCSPIASASAAAPRAIASIHFNCYSYSPFASASAAALDCIRFNCSLIASTLAAAPWLRPLRLQCSPIASTSTALAAAPRPAVLEDSSPWPMWFFPEFEVQKIEVRRSHVTSLVPPHEHPTSTDRQTHKHTVKILMYWFWGWWEELQFVMSLLAGFVWADGRAR